jgi:hypothetical protein
MAVFAGITGLLSVIVGWLVTARLFSLARRTRAAPERLLAIGFGGLFCVGYPFAGASRVPALAMTNEGALLFAIGALGMIVGATALGRFPYVVFRPGKLWAGWLSAVIAVIGTVGGLGSASVVAMARTKEAMIADIQTWALLLMLSIAVSYTWNGIESVRYYRIMLRRSAIGLANAETPHRFLLWSVACLTSVVSILAISAIRASGIPIMSPLPMALIACTSGVTTTCWALAFFMPGAYRRLVLPADGSDAGNAATH